jgi:hypothetical protein
MQVVDEGINYGVESHEHYEMSKDSFEKLKLGCLFSSRY